MGDPIIQLAEDQVQEIVDWLRDNFDDISRACEDNNLPKPPRFL